MTVLSRRYKAGLDFTVTENETIQLSEQEFSFVDLFHLKHKCEYVSKSPKQGANRVPKRALGKALLCIQKNTPIHVVLQVVGTL